MYSSHTTLGSRLRSTSLRYRRHSSARDPWRAWQCAVGQNQADTATRNDPATRDRRMARVEAVLLVAREPLSSRRLAMLANLADGTEARTLVRQLNSVYEQAATAFRVEDVAGGFRLLSRPKFSPWLRRACGAPAEIRLSAPALETLAVVAYRQPVLRVDIEAVRGVQCGEILRQLLERDLVRIAGRSEDLGRPFLYGTTRHFLQLFGLRSLESLPRVELFRSEDENATTDEPDLASSEDETGDEQVSTTIETPNVDASLDEHVEGGDTPEIQAVVLDDHGEFEEDDDDDTGDDDEDGFDMYGDYDDGEEDDGEDVEDADWEEVDDDKKTVDDDDEDWGNYDDDDIDDDDDDDEDEEED